jgi:hypothetical protein
MESYRKTDSGGVWLIVRDTRLTRVVEKKSNYYELKVIMLREDAIFPFIPEAVVWQFC